MILKENKTNFTIFDNYTDSKNSMKILQNFKKREIFDGLLSKAGGGGEFGG